MSGPDLELVPLPWATPAGDAAILGFGSSDELVEAAALAAEAALGAAGAAGADGPPGRRLAALLRRLAATDDAGPPLARAVRRWRLDEAGQRLVALLVAAELSPRALEAAMRLAGDPIRPGLTVEAASILFGGGAPGAAAIARMLAPGRPLVELGLVGLRYPELPLHRRILALAPRVLDVALGASEPDLATGAALIAPASALPLPPHAGAHAVLAGRPGVIGLVRGGRGALRALARHAADADRPLLSIELSSLADDGRARALARDAVFLGAAIAILIDVGGRDLARAARVLDRLAAHAPVFLLGGAGEASPPLGAGLVEIQLAPPSAPELMAALRAGFAGALTDAELAAIAAAAPLDLDAIVRAASTAAVRELPLSRVDGVLRALAEQVTPLDGGLGIRLPAAPGPLPDTAAADIEAVVARWRSSARPRRLRVLISGRPGAGKTAVAAAIAARLPLPAIAVEPRQLQRGPDHDPIAALLAVVARGAAALVLENIELVRANRPAGPDLMFPIAWLSRRDGLVIATTQDSISASDAALRREVDVAIELPARSAEPRKIP